MIPDEPVIEAAPVCEATDGTGRPSHYMRRIDGVWTCINCGWTKP